MSLLSQLTVLDLGRLILDVGLDFACAETQTF